MNKVLILDDRIERKKTHLDDRSISELNVCVSQGYLKMITGENLEKDDTFQYCDDYAMMAFHRSWLVSNNLMTNLEEYAKRTQKYLVVYSGGIGQTILLNDYKYLSINSALFYTSNLPKFIETYATSDEVEQPLLQLLYGNNWRLPIYMKYRQILWRGLSEEDKDYMDFELNYEQFIMQFRASTLVGTQNNLDDAIKNELIKTNVL